MTNKILLSVLLSFYSFFLSAAPEEKIKASSSIKQVTVFLSGAQITRTSKADVPKGTSFIVFEGVSPEIDEKSIQVKGAGQFTILSVSRQLNFMKEGKADKEPFQIYQQKLTDFDDKLSELNNDLEVYKAEEQMLIKNQTVINGNTTYDVVKLKQALDFQKERLKNAKSKQVTLITAIRKLQEELENYKNQYRENNGIATKTSTDIVVKVSAENVVKASFTITYLVKNASWYPFYDIRAKDANSKINLVYKANVSQNSGEDWNSIALTLSTGNPTVNNQIPVLIKYQLGYTSQGYGLNFQQNNVSVVSGKVTDRSGQALQGVSVRLKNSSLATATDVNGNYSLQLPSSSLKPELEFSYIGFETRQVFVNGPTVNVFLNDNTEAVNEVVVTGYGTQIKSALAGAAPGVRIRGTNSTFEAEPQSIALNVEAEEQPTNITFNIKNDYSVKSDGKNLSVDIANYEVNTAYEYYVVPKLNQNVYLLANVTGFENFNLITGEASVFYDGTYIGKTLINPGSTKDTLNISLGIDNNIIALREKEKNFKEVRFLGANKSETKSFVINLKNRKPTPVNLVVEDHLPVSTNSNIVVEKQEISNADYNEQTGKLIWKMTLKPGAEEKLYLKYLVKSPRNSELNLE